MDLQSCLQSMDECSQAEVWVALEPHCRVFTQHTPQDAWMEPLPAVLPAYTPSL